MPLVERNWWPGYASQWAGSRPPATTTHGRRAGPPRLAGTAAARCMAKVTRAEDAVGVVHQPHELARGRLAHQVGDAGQARVPVAPLAALDEAQSAPEVVHDPLIAGGVPPLGREVVLAPGHDDPEGRPGPRTRDGRRGLLLRLGQVDVAPEAGDGDAQAEAVLEELDVAVDEVVGPLVALVDQRVVRVQHLDARLALAQRREVGVVLPEGRAGGPHVRLELPRRGGVQVAHGGGEHQDVAGALERPQDQSPHGAPLRSPGVRRPAGECDTPLGGGT